MDFNIEQTINKINRTLEERGSSCHVEVVSKPEQSYQWDFNQLEKIKHVQEKEAKMNTIKQYAEMLYNGGFTVLSDERVRELRTKERVLEKLSGGIVSLCEEVIGVIDHD
ncbi:hypothetical protein [Macrococcus animalis]|uniref:hypothetical protein n=1 Tax=Macrococcus animalis TaxID=3395467 RepID=UPI0039BE5A60